MKTDKIPKQFFVEIRNWIDSGCSESEKFNPYNFKDNLGICYNLTQYLKLSSGVSNPCEGYDLMGEIFNEPYPFGHTGEQENHYQDLNDPSIAARIAFIETNLEE